MSEDVAVSRHEVVAIVKKCVDELREMDRKDRAYREKMRVKNTPDPAYDFSSLGTMATQITLGVTPKIEGSLDNQWRVSSIQVENVCTGKERHSRVVIHLDHLWF